jgi:hypothetical protein
MVVRRGLGIRRLPAGLKKIGEILWIMSSSKLQASLPWLSLAGMAAVFQPPLRRPLVTLLRKLDDILPPSGFVPGGLMTAIGRRGYLLSILGGDAWRTPAFCGGGTLVLDCLVKVSFRVLFVICKPLSSNARFIEPMLQGAFCKILYLPP